MISSIIYNENTKSFSKGAVDTSKVKTAAAVVGVTAAMNIVPAVIKIITRRYGTKLRDQVLQSRNDRINRLSDNYKLGVSSKDIDKKTVDKYRKELHALYEETLQLIQFRYSESNEGDLYIQVNQDQYGGVKSVSKSPVDRNTILERYINPLFVVLRMVLINQVHILAGTTMGADRRNFELAFDPDHKNPEDVIRNKFRTVLFKYPWPSHGFEVTTRGENEANKFIDSVIEFLANNPKYLSIRV